MSSDVGAELGSGDGEGRLFHIQMIISFTFLLAKDIHKFLLLMITRSFYSPVCKGYIRKVSVHLVQRYFPHDYSTDSLSFSKRLKTEMLLQQ